MQLRLSLAEVDSHYYAGFPSKATYGNSMVSLYTGRLTYHDIRRICVSSKGDKHSKNRDLILQLSKCSTLPPNEAPINIFQLLHVPSIYSQEERDLYLFNIPGIVGNVVSNSTYVLQVISTANTPHRRLQLDYHKTVPEPGTGYSLLFGHSK
jgi:hypothetical protein